MLRDNPVLAALGRRGAGAVVDELASRPGPWTLRALARAAGTSVMTTRRVVADLEALAAVEVLRPGRDGAIRLRESPMGDALRGLMLPDVRAATHDTFAAAYQGPGSVLRWRLPGERDDDPPTPTRLAVLSDDEAAWDALDSALDAVRDARLPAPDVSVHDPEDLDADDPTAAAVLAAIRAGN